MTSSLVGSEMCIRDRAKRAKRIAEDQQTDPQSVKPKVRPRRQRPEPVSYTHLTLPTICSV
eukprot:9709930-Prorocentrum_lima.AAC.1